MAEADADAPLTSAVGGVALVVPDELTGAGEPLDLEPTGAGVEPVAPNPVTAAPFAVPEPQIIRIIERVEVPVPYPVPAADVMKVLHSTAVFFAPGQMTVTPEGRIAIRLLAHKAKNALRAEIGIAEGHADSSGNPVQNQELSRRRAEAVLTELVQQGISHDIIKVVAMGDTSPLVPNDSAANRALNRRVDIELRGME
ncbi:MAG: OmpA family protein [Leptothrix sp. (in: b-proteobacteria)]